MTFESDIDAFRQKLEQRRRDLFVGVAVETLRSIQLGSEITGAPGQPVDTGVLRASWGILFEEPTVALISTNVVYAPLIEEGIGPHGPLQLRSQVGGFHSVLLTQAGFPRIVEHVARQVGAA